MKKSLKKLLTLSLAGCMALGVGIAATACNPSEDKHEHTFADTWTTDSAKHWHAATCEHKSEKQDEEAHSFGDDNKCTVCGFEKPDETVKADYTVTVKSPYGIAVDSVVVKWGTESATTDANGTATMNLVATTYAITLENLPDVYTYDEVSASKDNTAVTINLKLKDALAEGMILYTVRVLLPDGSPVEGVMVGLCDDAGCTPFVGNLTNGRGEAYKAFAPNTYEAQILSGLPEGYTYDGNTDENFKHYNGENATAEKPMITIHLIAE